MTGAWKRCFCQLFIDELAVLRLTECAVFSAAHCSEQTPGESDLALTERGSSLLATSSKLMKATFFSKKVARFFSMYLLWKKSCQKGLKVAKYSAKVALVTWELMAEGS